MDNGSTSKKSQDERIIYFDYLKVMATFAVIILHVSAQNWYYTDIKSFEWQVFNIYDSIVRWCVPIFVMVSGSLFLERALDIRRIYLKYIWHMITAFVFWGVIYALVAGGSFGTITLSIIQGHYHMWFIPMIIGLYICVPIIRKIVESKEMMQYTMIIAFLFNFLFPQIVQLANSFYNGGIIQPVINSLNNVLSDMQLHLVLGHVGYFIAGYYLNNIELNKKSRYVIYLLGVIGFLTTIGLSVSASFKAQSAVGIYYSYFSVNVLMETIAVFVWTKYHVAKYRRFNCVMCKLSKYSFGAYLVHALVIEQLNLQLGFNTLSFNPILSVPVIGALVFIVSFVVSTLLNHIPVVRKYVV